MAARRIALTLSLAALAAVSAPGGAGAAGCPNEAIRQQQGTTYLPNCMALEMVSPPQKSSAAAISPWFSASGERILFRSPALLGGSTSLVNALGDNYVASRGAGGWTTAATTAPGSFGFGFANHDQALALTPGFDRWVTFVATQPQFLAAKQTIYEGTLAGAWTRRSPLLESLNDPLGLNFEAFSSESPRAVSADFSHLVFRVGGDNTQLLQGDPQNGNSYIAHTDQSGNPGLELLARAGDGTVWGGNCGANVGGGSRNQGAISADGGRVIFSTRPGQDWDEEAQAGPACDTATPVRILVREETPAGAQIEELLPAASPGGSDFFEGASADQSKVYFATSRPLAATDLDADGLDLYLYEELPGGGDQILQVSAGGEGDPSPGEGADLVKGVTAISTDGSHVYFVARGTLTSNPNPEGAVAEEGEFNLYVYTRDAAHPGGRTAFVGELDSDCGAVNGDCRTLTGWPFNYMSGALAVPMRGSGSGDTLVFQTLAELTPGDSDGRRLDVYRYQADAEPPTLQCVSCRPGGPDPEPFDVVERAGGSRFPMSEFAEIQRWASESGRAIVFATAERLLPSDRDDFESPYLWLDGELTLLPGAKRLGSKLSYWPVVAAAGDQVAFQSSRALVPQDIDSAEDVYVARVDGGFPPPSAPAVPCAGSDGCQGSPTPGLPPASSPSETFAGAGNHRAQRKHGKKKSKKHGKKKRAGRNRGGGR